MHFHHDATEVVFIGLSAVVFINVMRMLAGYLVSKNVPIGSALGALVK